MCKKWRTPLGKPRGVRRKSQELVEASPPRNHHHHYLNIEPSEALLV